MPTSCWPFSTDRLVAPHERASAAPESVRGSSAWTPTSLATPETHHDFIGWLQPRVATIVLEDGEFVFFPAEVLWSRERDTIAG